MADRAPTYVFRREKRPRAPGDLLLRPPQTESVLHVPGEDRITVELPSGHLPASCPRTPFLSGLRPVPSGFHAPLPLTGQHGVVPAHVSGNAPEAPFPEQTELQQLPFFVS